MGKSKVKKVKQKTHKATKKRFKRSATGKILHLPQGAGNGHSNSYKNHRQRTADQGENALNAKKEVQKINTLLGK